MNDGRTFMHAGYPTSALLLNVTATEPEMDAEAYKYGCTYLRLNDGSDDPPKSAWRKYARRCVPERVDFTPTKERDRDKHMSFDAKERAWK